MPDLMMSGARGLGDTEQRQQSGGGHLAGHEASLMASACQNSPAITLSRP
jgi:hypothetical protein